MCCLAVGLPFFVLAVRSARQRDGRDINLRDVAQLAIFFLVCLSLTRLGPFTDTLWPGMILESLCALAFIWATRSTSRAGLTWNISPQAWRASAIVTILTLLFVVTRGLALKFTGLGAETEPIVFEWLLFQLTMPGIAEELAYRGVIQPGLNAALGRPWKLMGARVGWGWVITSVIFWGTHAFHLDTDMGFSFYWRTLTMQFIVGFVFGWVRERTGSVFPPMIVHNLVNVFWTLF
jgi:membrane protease YdiL (CAAX protease family)